MTTTLNNILEAPCAVIFNAVITSYDSPELAFLNSADQVADAVLTIIQNGGLDPPGLIREHGVRPRELLIETGTKNDEGGTAIRAQCWITEATLPLRHYLTFLSGVELELAQAADSDISGVSVHASERALALGGLTIRRPRWPPATSRLAAYHIR